MSNGKCILAFIFGAGVGAVVTWKFLNDRYERLVQEEVMSVKEALCKDKSDTVEQKDESFDIEAEADKVESEYIDRLREYHHTGEHDLSKPYIIHPDEFGMYDEYESTSLKCFADRVVTDMDNEIIEDVDLVVGDESLDHFGEFEPDAVYVRNDKLKCDYEILLDPRRYYTDIAHKKPHQAED